jgi:hypothetical protein
VPVGELVPASRRRFVTREAAMRAFSNAPALDPEQFHADVDRHAGQDPTPRG